MFRVHHVDQSWEIVKWLVLLTLAGALALCTATRTAGAASPSTGVGPPGPLSSEIDRWAKPLPPVDGPERGDFTPSAVYERNMQLWRVLEDHRQGHWALAVEGWSEVRLPPETMLWRYVALGAAHLQRGDLDGAAAALDEAEGFDPDAAVVHFYTGVLRLAQSERAYDWYDAVGPSPVRTVAHVPREVVPNSRAMYRLAGMMELEKAVEFAAYVPLNRPLLGGDDPTSLSYAGPTVEDLLAALGADRFERAAHVMLARLYLDRGHAEPAEHHLDGAYLEGADVVGGYRELARVYEEQARHDDAARAKAKAIRATRPPPPVDDLC